LATALIMTALRAGVFSREVWLPLNLGLISVEEAKASYVSKRADAGMTDADRLFDVVLESMSPLPGSVDLMQDALGRGLSHPRAVRQCP
jgi:hypothetical protein